MTARRALATPDDVIRRCAVDPTDTAAIMTALENASVAVRSWCHRAFTVDTFTHRIRARGNWLLLPQRPVISVESLAVIVYGQPTQTVGWVFDGLDRVWLGAMGSVINLPEELTQAIQFGVTVAEVSYSAGYVQIPDDVVTVTAGLAARALSTASGGLVSQQTAGPYSQTVASWATGGPLALSPADQDVLRPYRRAGASIELRL